MSETMRALVKSRPEPGLWLEEVPVPAPLPDEVLIRVRATGICGTDVHIHRWDEWAAETVPVPMTIGHEFVGEVVETGARVGGIQIGDAVSGEGHIVCGVCRNCRAGRRHLCEAVVGVGVNRPGSFADYLVLPQSNVWVHEPGIPRDVMAVFDPFGNAVHTALHFEVLGEDVLITGAGPIGLMACAVVRHAGARHVVVTDVVPERLELARRMGATRAVDARARDLDEVRVELGMEIGFDVGLEMSGNPSALRDMIAHMVHGGRIAMLGIPEAAAGIDWRTVVFKMLTIQGITGREMYETWYKMTAMLQSGLDIAPAITHGFPAGEFAEGFRVMMAGESGKVVLDWEGG